MEPPRISAYKLYFQTVESLAYILPWTVSIDLHSNFFWQTPKKTISFLQVEFRPCKVIILLPIESAYTTSYQSVIVTLFLSRTVSEILQVFCALTPPLFNPNFGGVPAAPSGPCWVSPRAKALSYSAVKLFSKYSHRCEKCTSTLRTDRQTDNIRSQYRAMHVVHRAVKTKTANR